MSFFKTEGIILKVIKPGENNLLYRVFFKDYGILSVSKRKKTKEKQIDVGYCVSCEIVTKEGRDIHTFGNIGSLHFFSPVNKNFKVIECFLSLLTLVHKNILAGHPHYEIYDILKYIIMHQDELSEDKILLGKLKILSVLGELSDTHRDRITQKTLKYIHTHSIKHIFLLGEIPLDVRSHLKILLP